MKTFRLPFLTQLDTRLLTEKNPLIQVLLGPRQVGKTTTSLYWLEKNYSPHEFRYVSAEEAAGHSDWLRQQWSLALTDDRIELLVVDEIQKIDNWSEVIKELWDKEQRKSKRLKILLLGSSSLNIQKGLSESLTGRFELIPCYHWGFKESKAQFGLGLNEYLCYGGYPGSYKFLKDTARWRAYLSESIVDTVIGKDILHFARVKAPALFRQAFFLLMSYPAQELSYSKILGQLQDQGNIDLVKYYIELFEGAFLLKSIFKYSKSEIRKKSSSPKIIPLAPALSAFARGEDLDKEFLGRIFEARVGADLLKAGFEVFYWRDGKYEVDFVIEHKRVPIAIEVKSNRKKSITGFSSFKDKFKKAETIVINFENYPTFAESPITFLNKIF